MITTDGLRRGAPAAALVLLAVAAVPAQAAPINVDLRVEGRTSTIYEGNVTTDVHLVRDAGGMQRTCDGTNGGAYPNPGPTATGALDDGARLRNFSWGGTWYDSFQDFLIDRIGPDSATSSEFWDLLIGYQEAPRGGCQMQVAGGDQVLWAFNGFGKAPLRLAGPGVATVGRPIVVRVTDGRDGAPEAGASVGGRNTGADGRASLVFTRPGAYRLKAEKPDAIRSNALVVCADPSDAAPCTSSDRLAPSLELAVPGTPVSRWSRSRTVFLSWLGDDGAGSGVADYDASIREVSNGLGGPRFKAGDWWRLLVNSKATGVRFRGRAGGTFELQVSARDRATNRTTESALLTFPVDDRRLLLGRGGWRRLERRGAWGGEVVRSKRRGARGKLIFRGSRVTLIGRRLRRGGRLLLTVDGHHKVVRLRGRPRYRQELYTSAKRRFGRHVLRVRALGSRPVELDGIAPLP